MSDGAIRYFAYGSNMISGPLKNRAPSAEKMGIAELPGWRFAFNKRGRDGSAKANLFRSPADKVWGVLFRISRSDLKRLDELERGYNRKKVQVSLGNKVTTADTYISTRLTTALPSETYFALVIAGAREHHLPDAYVDRLRRLCKGPDREDQSVLRSPKSQAKQSKSVKRTE
jgi:gamma-glutamylcyclotransferase